jgi:hypothetical protein
VWAWTEDTAFPGTALWWTSPQCGAYFSTILTHPVKQTIHKLHEEESDASCSFCEAWICPLKQTPPRVLYNIGYTVCHATLHYLEIIITNSLRIW